MSELADWNVSAGSNNADPPNGWPEGMKPSLVNNTAREGMAVLARFYGDVNGTLSSTGSANAYALAPNATISAYAAGQHFAFKANFTNTGAATLNVNSLGTKNIRKGDGTVALASGDILSGQIALVYYDGTQFQLLNPITQITHSLPCEFRLTYSSGTPVPTTDITGASAVTLYATPYIGNRIALYDGASRWNIRTSAEFSISLASTSTSTVYDVFCYDNSGVPTLELLAWSSGTARATALTTQDGIYVKSGATTRRYLGSLYMTSVSGQSEDSANKRYLWNMYNRRPRKMLAQDSTNTWTYTTAAFRQANNSGTNALYFIRGLDEDTVSASCVSGFLNSGGGSQALTAIGLDATNAKAADCINSYSPSPSNLNPGCTWAHYEGFPGMGYHYLAWLEYSVTTSGTTTWYGDNGASIIQTGIRGTVWA